VYGGRVVIDRLDLDLPTGVVPGFFGPNGAGKTKTTTIRMFLGLPGRPGPRGGCPSSC
jgi:ABC-2 type transport system ATP-binding protein